MLIWARENGSRLCRPWPTSSGRHDGSPVAVSGADPEPVFTSVLGRQARWSDGLSGRFIVTAPELPRIETKAPENKATFQIKVVSGRVEIPNVVSGGVSAERVRRYLPW
jgi:hypothetical protein